jgi:hypothetical protein
MKLELIPHQRQNFGLEGPPTSGLTTTPTKGSTLSTNHPIFGPTQVTHIPIPASLSLHSSVPHSTNSLHPLHALIRRDLPRQPPRHDTPLHLPPRDMEPLKPLSRAVNFALPHPGLVAGRFVSLGCESGVGTVEGEISAALVDGGDDVEGAGVGVCEADGFVFG